MDISSDFRAWRLIRRYARAQQPKPDGYWADLEDALAERLEQGEREDAALRGAIASQSA